jgi:hypothetical protein
MSFSQRLKEMLQRLSIKMQQFMVGRYGNDEFTMFLLIVSLLFTFLGNFRPLRLLYFIGSAIIFYSLFRTLSKNYEARRKELNWYLRVSQKPKAEIKILMSQLRDRKTHRDYRCKSCKTVMRVPKGRGKIEITCPKCRMKVIKKT